MTPSRALTAAQVAAVDHVRALAAGQQVAARQRIVGVLVAAGLPADDDTVDQVVHAVSTAGRIALNFHPDRLVRDGRTVVEALLAEGVYRSQFVTGISNGGLTAVPGGDRDRWEEALFGGAYQRPDVEPEERPVYGGLDLLGHPDGPCPRFGSCHLQLRPAVRRRTTLCHGDSHLGPTDRGTPHTPAAVLAGLLEQALRDGAALGRVLGPAELVQRILHPGGPRPATAHGRALDDYIEAQVHGPVVLAEDVAALVADPSFDETEIGRQLRDLADAHGLPLTWHAGFQLDVSAVPAAMRGPAIPVLAARIADRVGGGAQTIDAELIGRAARSVVREPDRWADHADVATTLQHLKQLWHVLVRHGRPRD